MVVMTLVAVLLGTASCGSAAASPGKVICPSSDKFSCYYAGTDAPVRGPRSIDGYRVVGVLPAYCTQKSQRCGGEGGFALFFGPKSVKGPHPTGEYIEWNIRGGGPNSKLATYVTQAEEHRSEFGQLPGG
jgi:hypothetical protein